MTAPEEPVVTEPTPEPWPLPNIWRLLPADITDQAYMDTIAEMQQEIRDQGCPDNMNKAGVSPLDDGRWLAQAWQAQQQWDWTYPPVDAAAFQ